MFRSNVLVCGGTGCTSSGSRAIREKLADELKAKAESYFNKAVARKGVDTSKPFESEKHDEIPDFSDDAKILQDAGLLPKEDK